MINKIRIIKGDIRNTDDLKLAIGKGAVNIRLASKLTKYHLTIKSMTQINEEGNK